MMSVGGIGDAGGVRRAKGPEAERSDTAGGSSRLPVPVEPVRRVEHRAENRAERRPAASAFAAQMLAQPGEKRGLRAGPELMIRAERAYNRAEYSGANDRRAPLGARVQARV